MSDWDTVIIGKNARPAGSGGASQGPTALQRAKAVGAVTDNDRKGTCNRMEFTWPHLS